MLHEGLRCNRMRRTNAAAILQQTLDRRLVARESVQGSVRRTSQPKPAEKLDLERFARANAPDGTTDVISVSRRVPVNLANFLAGKTANLNWQAEKYQCCDALLKVSACFITSRMDSTMISGCSVAIMCPLRDSMSLPNLDLPAKST